jgi:hypothetical protein
MVERNPNYKLAHVLQGDLLMARAGKPVAFAAKLASVETMAPIQDEARVRMQRYLDAPPVNYLPAALLQLGPRQAHALVIDTSRSRLFVYANDLGRPRYVTDFYISLGKNGVDKTREGDQKTPIGVYTILSLKDKLPDFYGRGAYPLSYPNDWDRENGREGHGIWLHGTPSDTYARPPRATDGCVVLTNEDLARLTKYVDRAVHRMALARGVAGRPRFDPEGLRAMEVGLGEPRHGPLPRQLFHPLPLEGPRPRLVVGIEAQGELRQEVGEGRRGRREPLRVSRHDRPDDDHLRAGLPLQQHVQAHDQAPILGPRGRPVAHRARGRRQLLGRRNHP